MKKFETLLVEQRAIAMVECTRTVSLMVPVGCRDLEVIESLIFDGETEFGPFLFDIEDQGTSMLLGSRVLGRTKAPADIPFVERTGA